MAQKAKERGREEQQAEALPVHHHPFRSLATGTRLGQLLDEFFGPSLFGPSLFSSFAGAGARIPAVDVEEDDDCYYVCIEVPGVQREDLDVEIDRDMVTVRGERRRVSEGTKPRWTERTYGRFVRSFSIPSDVDPDQVRAEFRDGLLTLTLPKREHARPRRIEIGGGDGAARGRERVAQEGAEQHATG